MNTKRNRIIISILISTLLMFVLVGCSSTSDSGTDTASEEEVKIVDNEKINDFMMKYNSISDTPFENADNSSRDYKASAECKGYAFTIEDLDSEFRVTIDETNETADAGVTGMRDVFCYVVKSMDDTITDDEIYSWFDAQENAEHMVEDQLGSLAISYTPDMELSNGLNRGHITISATSGE